MNRALRSRRPPAPEALLFQELAWRSPELERIDVVGIPRAEFAAALAAKPAQTAVAAVMAATNAASDSGEGRGRSTPLARFLALDGGYHVMTRVLVMLM